MEDATNTDPLLPSPAEPTPDATESTLEVEATEVREVEQIAITDQDLALGLKRALFAWQVFSFLFNGDLTSFVFSLVLVCGYVAAVEFYWKPKGVEIPLSWELGMPLLTWLVFGMLSTVDNMPDNIFAVLLVYTVVILWLTGVAIFVYRWSEPFRRQVPVVDQLKGLLFAWQFASPFLLDSSEDIAYCVVLNALWISLLAASIKYYWKPREVAVTQIGWEYCTPTLTMIALGWWPLLVLWFPVTLLACYRFATGRFGPSLTLSNVTMCCPCATAIQQMEEQYEETTAGLLQDDEEEQRVQLLRQRLQHLEENGVSSSEYAKAFRFVAVALAAFALFAVVLLGRQVTRYP